MNHLKPVYYTIFLLFYRVFCSAWPASINVWKGVGGVTLVQVLAIISISSCLEIFAGFRTLNAVNPWAIRLGIIALFFGNHLLLVQRGEAVRFEQEFASLPRSTKTRLMAISVILLVVVVVCFIASGLAHRRLVDGG